MLGHIEPSGGCGSSIVVFLQTFATVRKRGKRQICRPVSRVSHYAVAHQRCFIKPAALKPHTRFRPRKSCQEARADRFIVTSISKRALRRTTICAPTRSLAADVSPNCAVPKCERTAQASFARGVWSGPSPRLHNHRAVAAPSVSRQFVDFVRMHERHIQRQASHDVTPHSAQCREASSTKHFLRFAAPRAEAPTRSLLRLHGRNVGSSPRRFVGSRTPRTRDRIRQSALGEPRKRSSDSKRREALLRSTL